MRKERVWFGRRWAQEAIEYYRGKRFACSGEIAAVIAVFERPTKTQISSSIPLLSKPASAGSTKYNIDPTHTGKVREKAKKNSAKKIKKKAAKKDKDNKDSNSSIGGAGGVTMSV